MSETMFDLFKFKQKEWAKIIANGSIPCILIGKDLVPVPSMSDITVVKQNERLEAGVQREVDLANKLKEQSKLAANLSRTTAMQASKIATLESEVSTLIKVLGREDYS